MRTSSDRRSMSAAATSSAALLASPSVLPSPERSNSAPIVTVGGCCADATPTDAVASAEVSNATTHTRAKTRRDAVVMRTAGSEMGEDVLDRADLDTGLRLDEELL